ncbi:chromate transporter [Cytobacillus sp. Hz8]|uniref:chromate transporter n=1 Tax=Cytobacillus sp. Hz8 TaxID=3347168 RepID=UPI0035D89646
MKYIHIFMAFFLPSILGYGGGPASIPLIEKEVVDHYGWLTVHQFSEVLAFGNSLPGPIATKMAGYIGFQQGGFIGSIVALFATIAPSLILMILFLGLIYKYKDSANVKKMTQNIRPAIAVLLGIITVDFFLNSYQGNGMFMTIFLILASFLLLEKWKVHPAYVITGALVFGAIFLH